MLRFGELGLVYVGISSRLRARRSEIEEAALTRVYVVSSRFETTETKHSEGLRTAVSAALDYGFAGLECSEDGSVPPPPFYWAQARFAARNNISLDTVLRRYFAGYTLLGDFPMQEAGNGGLFGETPSANPPCDAL